LHVAVPFSFIPPFRRGGTSKHRVLNIAPARPRSQIRDRYVSQGLHNHFTPTLRCSARFYPDGNTPGTFWTLCRGTVHVRCLGRFRPEPAKWRSYPMLRTIMVSLLLVLPIHAQSFTGTISGRVTDPSGAVIPQVVVTVTDAGTNTSSRTMTGETGDYSVT